MSESRKYRRGGQDSRTKEEWERRNTNETKKFVQIYGKVVLPIIRGMTVRYFSNGTWKETARVRRVIEVTDAYIKFETDRIRYCIDFGMVEDNAMPIAA